MGVSRNASTRKRKARRDDPAAHTDDDEPDAITSRRTPEISTSHVSSFPNQQMAGAASNRKNQQPKKPTFLELNVDEEDAPEEESENKLFVPLEKVRRILAASSPVGGPSVGSAQDEKSHEAQAVRPFQDDGHDDSMESGTDNEDETQNVGGPAVGPAMQVDENSDSDQSSDEQSDRSEWNEDAETAADCQAQATEDEGFVSEEQITVDSGVDVASGRLSAQINDREDSPPALQNATKTRSRKKQTVKATLKPGYHAKSTPAASHQSVTEKPEHLSTPSPAKKRRGRSKKKPVEDNDVPDMVDEVDPDFDLTAEELLVTAEIGNDSIDKIVDLMGHKKWTAAGSDWIAQISGPDDAFRVYRSKSTRRLGRRLARLAVISKNLAKLLDPAERRQPIEDVQEDNISTIVGQLSEIQDHLLPAVSSDDSDDLAHNVVPLMVALLYAFALTGAQDLPGDPRMFYSTPWLRAMIKTVDLILRLTEFIWLTPVRDKDTAASRQAQPLLKFCIVLRNELVTAKNDIVEKVSDARYAAAERRRVQKRKAAAVAREEEQRRAMEASRREREAKVQASIQEFLTKEDDEHYRELDNVEVFQHVNPSRVKLTWGETCLRVLAELRGSDHPDLARMGQTLGYSTEDVWEMIDAIKEEAERAEREDGISIPDDLSLAFATLYE